MPIVIDVTPAPCLRPSQMPRTVSFQSIVLLIFVFFIFSAFPMAVDR